MWPHRACIFLQVVWSRVILQYIARSSIFGWCCTILPGTTLGCVLLWSSQNTFEHLLRYVLCQNNENSNVVESTNHTPAPSWALAMRIRQHPPSQWNGSTTWPGCRPGGYNSTFKLLAVQDLQQQVTCIHSLVRWPRRASRTSKISKNLFFSQKFSKYLFLSQKIFKNLLESLEIFKKLRKESVNSEYLKISWDLSKNQKCI